MFWDNRMKITLSLDFTQCAPEQHLHHLWVFHVYSCSKSGFDLYVICECTLWIMVFTLVYSSDQNIQNKQKVFSYENVAYSLRKQIFLFKIHIFFNQYTHTDLQQRTACGALSVGEAPLHLFFYSSFGCAPVQSWSTWSARDSVNCRYLMAFLCAGVEKLLEVCTHSIAWLELRMKTQRHCFQWSNPLYSNSTAFLSHIPKPPLLCEGFFFPFEKETTKTGYKIFIWFTVLTAVLAETITQLINHYGCFKI